MAQDFALSHRALLRALLDAGGCVYASDLARIAGIGQSSITPAMSVVRAAIAPHGAVLKTAGSRELMQYYLRADNLEPLHALAAVPEGRAWFMGFCDRYALVLRQIVEAGGTPIALTDIVTALYGKPYKHYLTRVAGMVEQMRQQLAKHDAEKTILHRGRPGAQAYAWGLVEAASEPVPMLREGVTLPPVGGAYHFAAGRLTLDGRPAGRAA